MSRRKLDVEDWIVHLTRQEILEGLKENRVGLGEIVYVRNRADTYLRLESAFARREK